MGRVLVLCDNLLHLKELKARRWRVGLEVGMEEQKMAVRVREVAGKIWIRCPECGGRGTKQVDDPDSPIGKKEVDCERCKDSEQPGKILEKSNY